LLTAAIAALGNRADEPTATMGIDGACAELAGAKVNPIARVSSALQIFNLFIKRLLSDFLLLPDIRCHAETRA
jgi:hypothetical protein